MSYKKKILLKQTCSAHPEQYDAFCNGKPVGYLRLRYGRFTVSVPNARGERVFEAHPKGSGMFEDDEREFYLNCAKDVIAKQLK